MYSKVIQKMVQNRFSVSSEESETCAGNTVASSHTHTHTARERERERERERKREERERVRRGRDLCGLRDRLRENLRWYFLRGYR